MYSLQNIKEYLIFRIDLRREIARGRQGTTHNAHATPAAILTGYFDFDSWATDENLNIQIILVLRFSH